jgi:hypothetical protein
VISQLSPTEEPEANVLFLRTVTIEPLTKELVYRDSEEHGVKQILNEDILAKLVLEHPDDTHFDVTAADGCVLRPVRKFHDDWRILNLLRFDMKRHYLANLSRLEMD